MKTYLIFTDLHRAEVATAIKQNIKAELPNARVVIIDDMDLHANPMLDLIESLTVFKVNKEKREARKEEKKAERNVDELPAFSNEFLEKEESYQAMVGYFKKFTPDVIITIGYGAFQEAIATRDYLGSSVKIVNYIDDYTLNKMLVSPYMDGYIVENLPMKKQLMALGIEPKKIAISALAIENKYFDEEEIAGNYRLALNHLRPTMLYVARNDRIDHKKNVNALKKYENKVNLIIYCGYNRESYKYCLKEGLNAFNEGVSLPMLYNKADVVFTTGNSYDLSVARVMGKLLCVMDSELILEQRNLTYLKDIVVDCTSNDNLKTFFNTYPSSEHRSLSLRAKVVVHANILGALEKILG